MIPLLTRSVPLLLLALTPPAAAQWSAGPTLANARHAPGVVRHGGDIYAIGGFSSATSVEVLYSGHTAWTPRAPLPTGQEGLAAAVVGDRIYTFGSYGPASTCQIYDIATNTWQSGPPVPIPLYWSTAETVDTEVLLIGGYSPPGGASAALFILDTTTHTWRQGTSLPGVMQIPASVRHGSFVYVFVNGRYYKYDVAGGTWSTFTAPPSGHGGGSEAVSVGHFVYLIGGSPGNIFTAYQTVEIYDPSTDRWTTGPSLANGRYQFGAVYLPNEGHLYAVAGRDSTASSMTGVEVLAAVPNGFQRYGAGTTGGGGVPVLGSTGTAALGANFTLDVSGGLGNAPAVLLFGFDPASKIALPVLGGTLLVQPLLSFDAALGGAGSTSFPVPVPNDPGLRGLNANTQAVILDAGAPGNVAMTNGLAIWVR